MGFGATKAIEALFTIVAPEKDFRSKGRKASIAVRTDQTLRSMRRRAPSNEASRQRDQIATSTVF